jgi:acylphosphatase
MNEVAGIICHVSIRGRVQGVGFRAFVEHEALKRGIEGWVRNRRDGSVEALFAGPEKSMMGMIAACRAGPGHVDAIDQRDGTEDEFKLRRAGELFSVLATA